METNKKSKKRGDQRSSSKSYMTAVIPITWVIGTNRIKFPTSGDATVRAMRYEELTKWTEVRTTSISKEYKSYADAILFQFNTTTDNGNLSSSDEEPQGMVIPLNRVIPLKRDKKPSYSLDFFHDQSYDFFSILALKKGNLAALRTVSDFLYTSKLIPA